MFFQQRHATPSNARRWLSASLLFLVSLAAPGCAGSSQSSDVYHFTGFHSHLALQVLGNKLVDAAGKPIRLLGVSRSGAEYACVQGLGVIAGPTSAASIEAMTSWGIDAVRIPLNEDCWLGINGVPAGYSGAAYRDTVRAFVAELNQDGLYVVLDLHWNAPGRNEATSQRPMPDADHAPAFWSSVAAEFKLDRAVAFDLFNDPYGISWQCWRDGCQMPKGWRAAGMQALIDAVRSTGARQPIIVPGVGSGTSFSAWLRYEPRDPDHELVAGMHVYNFLACNTAACWSQAGSVARTVPVVATEVGETDCATAFVSRFMQWADVSGVSYLAWSWTPGRCRAPALISSWAGQPTPYGAAVRAHLAALRRAGQLP